MISGSFWNRTEKIWWVHTLKSYIAPEWEVLKKGSVLRSAGPAGTEGIKMRILELQIKNFGKFADKTLRFHQGMNIMTGANEAGKTTIVSFICGMFYGIEKQRGRASGRDEYSLRQPWENPAYFAGVMHFESGGRSFVWREVFTPEKSGHPWYVRRMVRSSPLSTATLQFCWRE